MIICVVVYVCLMAFWIWSRKSIIAQKFSSGLKRQLFLVLFVSNTIAMMLFVSERLGDWTGRELTRNSYGAGSRTENYQVTVEGEAESESIEIEIEERQYTSAKIQEIFKEMMEKLDEVILGENESRDRVEKDLNLVDTLEEYPVDIQWELSNYEVLDGEGSIIQEKTTEEGTLVEVRGRLTYGEEEAVYVTHVMIFPETKTEKEIWLDEIQQAVKETEEATREQESFTLPERVQGKQVQWKKQSDVRGYYILMLGVLGSVLLVWKKKQDEKEAKQKCVAQMIRDYPDIISKFTLLLSTGMTVKNVWTKIVESYEEQKMQSGVRFAYEEMRTTSHEMKSGVPEAEAYERFGQRCQVALYMKLGALLTQNLRKGSRGLSELLKMESIQAFENRKSMAKRMGEEASTKLLLPMFGMLAVVMIMIIVPAFLSIQL